MPADQLSTDVHNVCAGPFGAVYDFYIEHPRIARLVLGLMWGVDPRPFYSSLKAVAQAPDGATILDVPCGGGVALQGLRADQRVSWIGVDAAPTMLDRARRRAARYPTVQSRFIEGDMYALPVEDSCVDLCLNYGGLHCVSDPAAAIAEIARCLRPGKPLVGTAFLAQGSRRQRRLLRGKGFGRVGTADELRQWLRDGGFTDESLDRNDGLVLFSAQRFTCAPSSGCSD